MHYRAGCVRNIYSMLPIVEVYSQCQAAKSHVQSCTCQISRRDQPGQLLNIKSSHFCGLPSSLMLVSSPPMSSDAHVPAESRKRTEADLKLYIYIYKIRGLHVGVLPKHPPRRILSSPAYRVLGASRYMDACIKLNLAHARIIEMQVKNVLCILYVVYMKLRLGRNEIHSPIFSAPVQLALRGLVQSLLILICNI